MGIDHEALARRILSPERPRLNDALAVVRGIRDADKAWQALAAEGLVPVDWLANPSREFRYRDDSRVARGLTIWGTAPQPASVIECVAFAADVSGVTTAEALARELVDAEGGVMAQQMDGREWRMSWRCISEAEAAELRPDCMAWLDRVDPRARRIAYDLLFTGYVVRHPEALSGTLYFDAPTPALIPPR